MPLPHTHPITRTTLTAMLSLLVLGCSSKPASSDRPLNLPPRHPVPENLPPSFTDRVPNSDNGYAEFKMILIPGDASRDLPPFYIGETEVTWGMLMYWAWGNDLDDPNAIARLQVQGLRPSIIGHGHPQADDGLIWNDHYPATGLSWQTARQYCIWLSSVTGRSYRLPTDTEWKHITKLAGGIPEQRDELLSQGTFIDNTPEMDQPPYIHLPRDVAQGKPNKLGLYDWLGNAAEWVQPMSGKRWVRGGHYLLPADKFDADWIAIEDQETWNASYPQLPYSQHWYIDHIYQGIRLVCEVERIQETDQP